MSQYFQAIGQDPIVNLPLYSYSPTVSYFQSAPNGGTTTITSSTNFDSVKGCEFNSNTSVSFNGFDTSTTICFNLYTISTGTSSSNINTTLLSVGDISVIADTSNSLLLRVMNQRNAYSSSKSITINDGWHYITLVINIVSGVSTVTLYVDAYNKYNPITMTSFPVTQTNIKPITIGRSQYNGYITDLGIFNTALTDANVQKLFCTFIKNPKPNVLPTISTDRTYNSMTINASGGSNIKELIIICDKAINGIAPGNKLNTNNTNYTANNLVEGNTYNFTVSVLFLCDPVPRICSNPICVVKAVCPVINTSSSTSNQLILNINGNNFSELIIKCDNIVGSTPINTKLNTSNSNYSSPILLPGTYNFTVSIKDSLDNVTTCNIITKVVNLICPIIDKSSSKSDQLIMSITGGQFSDLLITCDNTVGNIAPGTKLNTNNSSYSSPILPIGIYNFAINIKDQNGNFTFCRNIYINVGEIVPKNMLLANNLPLLAIILGTMYGFMILCIIARHFGFPK